mmetsp:Transcript_26/g.83  ORF Transcript_26/g.83 Transcript_26/m.83 type:complete len:215 (-) Transcript_26:1266-1910(-)
MLGTLRAYRTSPTLALARADSIAETSFVALFVWKPSRAATESTVTSKKSATSCVTTPLVSSFSTLPGPTPSNSCFAKCTVRCFTCSGHCDDMHRAIFSGIPLGPVGRRTSGEPHAGHSLGGCHLLVSSPSPGTAIVTRGITSPARSTTTRPPTTSPRPAATSRLCSVAFVTVTPPNVTCDSRARGVTCPLRPTRHSTASSVVTAASAGRFRATA